MRNLQRLNPPSMYTRQHKPRAHHVSANLIATWHKRDIPVYGWVHLQPILCCDSRNEDARPFVWKVHLNLFSPFLLSLPSYSFCTSHHSHFPVFQPKQSYYLIIHLDHWIFHLSYLSKFSHQQCLLTLTSLLTKLSLPSLSAPLTEEKLPVFPRPLLARRSLLEAFLPLLLLLSVTLLTKLPSLPTELSFPTWYAHAKLRLSSSLIRFIRTLVLILRYMLLY